MRLKQFMLAFVAMFCFSFSAFSQETVVVNSYAELKAELEKRATIARAGAARSATANDAKSGLPSFGVVQLGNDIVLSETFTIGASQLVLDLNGHSISPAQGTNYHIINLGSFILQDESAAKTGTVNCAIQNGSTENDYAYLEILGGTVKSVNADGAAVTNHGECVISGGNFLSEYTGLTNYNKMEIDGGNGEERNVYIEGKTYSIKNSAALSVESVVIAGTEDNYLAEGNATATFDNVKYLNVALNGKAYDSLQKAIDNAVDGDLIRLFGDIKKNATVTINKAISIDGNGKALKNAIRVAETTGNVNITDLTVSAEDEYALQVESAATVNVKGSNLSGEGAVKATNGFLFIDNTNLTGTDCDVISVASATTVSVQGGNITASKTSDEAKFFIIGGKEGCEGAQLSIMPNNIDLTGAVNYIKLDTDKNTVFLNSKFENDLYNKGYVTDKKGISLTVYNAVANVDNKNYRTLGEALDAATNGSTVTLLWADYKAPIAMNGSVFGKNVTIKGTATVDWSKGWFYLGRGGEGNATVTFDGANLTSASNSASNGIHVSGREKGTDNKYNGTLVIKNSTIVLDYLINRGAIELGEGAVLTVKNGFGIAGRPANETESGEAATATVTLDNGSKLVVNNHNGMGLGQAAEKLEGYGVMNVNAGATFETTQAFNVTVNGTMNVNGGTVKIAEGTKLTNNGTVYVTGAANLDATVTGAGWFYMNGVDLNANTNLVGAKVAFINGTNNIVGSTVKDGWFNVGLGQNSDAAAAAAFATANGITMGNVVVNVSGNANIGSAGNAYRGWVGSAYSADKTQHTYALNVENSLAAFGYMHVSKDGTLTVDGRSADNNRYTYDNANVNFYAGELIVNGEVTLNNADAWAKFTKMSVDATDGILNINGDTKFESSIHNGSNTEASLKFWQAGKVNVAKTATVEVDNQTILVDGAELNIAGNVTAKGTVTGNGTITLTDKDAVYTAPADLTVGTNIADKMVLYKEGAYKVYNPAAKIDDVFYLTLQEAINAAVDGDVITFVNNVTEDVTVAQAPDVKITIDGADKTMKGTITVDGKSARYATAGLHIKNVKFDATDVVSYDACVRLGAGNNSTRYTNNVTVDNCTFTDDDYSTVAVKSYTGGDWNLQIINCTAEGMHSLAQLANVEQGLVISGNIANTKNGINLNQTATGTIEENTINVKGYAVRAGVDDKIGGNITLTKNTLTTDNSEGDPVIVLRGTVEALNMTKNVVSGNTHIKGTATTVAVDENYWDGKTAPVVAEGSPAINVNSYYSDEACTTLVRNEMGSINAFVSADRITGDVVSNAKESLVITVLGADNTPIGTATLEKSEYITGFNKQLTWRINLGADDSDSWAMAWTNGAPSVNNLPAKVVLVVDGKEVATADVKFTNDGDGRSPVFAAKTDADGKILSFIACDGEYNLNNAANKLVSASADGDNIAILKAGTYNVPTGKNLTITGAVDGVVFDNIGAKNMGGANVTFNKVTFDYYPNVNYTGLQHSGDLVYNNCTINGQVFLYGQSETFNNCTFNQESAGAYNVWTYSADHVEFNNCTFNSAGKSVLVYNEGDGATDLVVTETEFHASAAVEDKAAIEIDTSLMPGQTTITIDGETTAEGFANGNVSGNPLWNNKQGDGKIANDNNDITVVVDGVTVLQPTYEAKIGDTMYKYFTDAIKDVKNGETITLVDDYEGTVHINKSNVAFTIDGAISETVNAKFTGKIEINIGQNVTVKNVDFVWTDDAANDFIANVGSPTGKNYNTTLLVEDCSFTGNGKENVVAVRTIHPTSVVIKNCTATGMHSFLQNTGGQSIYVEGVTITDSKSGLSIGSPNNIATVKNCNLSTSNYGIRLDAVTAGTGATLENNVVNAYIPVSVRKASAATYDLSFSGDKSAYTATNDDNVWCAICTTEYEPGVDLNPATGNVSVELNDSGLPLEGIYGNFGVASIGKATYLTFEEALDAVQNGETIVLTGATGSEINKEIEFTKDIVFTITGNAPEYALPIVTFQNATVNIENATILIPELDARQNATINVVKSTVYDAGGNSIAKSYYNGTINIDENSTVYMMQVTTMGYINVAGTLNATWQTNVYGNGMITLANGATFNTAALHLTAQDYSGRDNTDAERVGKPAAIIVDGATLNIGKVLSAGGSDYSYNSSKGINVGTINDKSAILDIKNGGAVNIYMANGETANFGAGATVNVDASTLTTACRAAEGTVTLANAGVVNVTGASTLNVKNFTGNAINVTDATLADVQFGGAVNAFGTNNISGTSAINGVLSVGYNGEAEEAVVVNITGNFNGTNVLVGSSNESILNVGVAEGARTTAHFGQLGAFGDVTINNADVTYGYAFIRNDLNVTNSALEIKGGVNTYFSGNAKVVIDNSTWNLPGFANIGSYGGYMYGNADVTLKNGSVMTATKIGIERYGDYVVNVTIDKTSTFNATELTNQGVMNVAGAVTASKTLTNTGTINFTSLGATLATPTEGVVINHGFDERYKIVYEDGVYKFGDFVAEINGVYYETIDAALKALTDGATLKFLNDVTVAEAWDCRFNGALIDDANVTIDGNGKTLKLTGAVDDKNWNTVFRVEGDNATFKKLTIDASEATGVQRGITAKLSITVDSCKFIGNGTTSRYGVIFGEGAQGAIAEVVATVTNSEFVNSTYGVSDNRNGQDAKNVTVTGNKFQNSNVLLSASEKVEFNNNVMNGGGVNITSYSKASNVDVNAAGNTLDATQDNRITTNPANQNVQDGFAQPVVTSNNVYYLTLPDAIEKAADGAEITLLNSVVGAGAVINKSVTIDFGGWAYSFNEGVGSGDLTSNGFQILKDNNVTLKNGILNVNADDAAEFYTIIQNYANLTVKDMTLDGTYLDKWSTTDGDSYVLSNNSGNVLITGNTHIVANDEGEKAFAFDACKYQSYDAPVVTVETTGHIAGLIESTATIVIYDGTYTMDVTKWCAEGLTAEPDGNGNYTIVTGTTFIDGQFTSYNNTQDKVVEYIHYERTFPADAWQAVYVPFEIPVDTLAKQGFEVAYINGVRRSDNDENGEFDEGGFSMELIMIHGGKGNANGTGKTLKANYPYFVRAKGEEKTLVIELKDATLYSAESKTYDCTTFAEKFEITGNVSQVEVNSTDDAIRYVVTSSGSWSQRTIPGKVKPFRFYMTVTSRDNSPVKDAPASMSIVVRGQENEDGTTTIYDIEAETGDEFIFDLTGRRVLETEKGGIYIKNGKKVLVK